MRYRYHVATKGAEDDAASRYDFTVRLISDTVCLAQNKWRILILPSLVLCINPIALRHCCEAVFISFSIICMPRVLLIKLTGRRSCIAMVSFKG
jgi:hypothetical protein